jgi:hypothetical protein
MHSRTLPTSILPPAAGAGLLLPRPLCDPDQRARRLQARQRAGPGPAPAQCGTLLAMLRVSV